MRTVKRALSLLKADQGLRDREIADVLLVNAATVARARKRYVEEGLEAAYRVIGPWLSFSNLATLWITQISLTRDIGSAVKGINGFWSHINIVYLLNLLFNILKTRISEQYR